MTDLLFITSSRFTPAVLNLIQELVQGGISCNWINSSQPESAVLESAENVQTIAAVLDDESIEQLLYCAYFSGRNTRVVLVDPGEHVHLPIVGSLKRIPLGPSTVAELIKHMRPAGTSIGPVPQDRHEFLTWATKYADRIGELPTAGFEQLISVLLWHAGLGHGSKSRDDPHEFLTDFTARTRVYVECKRLSESSRVDLSIIRDVITRARSHKCESIVLATNSALTRSARAFVDTCVPPVWYIDLNAIQSLVKALVEIEHGVSDPQTPGLICPAWNEHRHHHKEDAILDRICIPGNHDLSPGWLESCGIEKVFSGNEPIRPTVFLFFPLKEQVRSDLTTRMILLLDKLDASGARVWHNSPLLSVGQRCIGLQDYARAMRESGAFWIFDEVDHTWSHEDLKTLNWVAAEFLRSGAVKPTVVSGDACRSRLRLPRCFSDGTFVDQSDWVRALTRMTGEVLSALERAGEAAETKGPASSRGFLPDLSSPSHR